MNKIFRNTISILNKKEKNILGILTAGDILISVFDILFLIGFLYIIRFYTASMAPGQGSAFIPDIMHEHPLLLITIFFLAFAAKNLLGFLLSKLEFNFVYQVASRISRGMLQLHLDSTYIDHVRVDSSVVNRKISQQPIEFSHYVLNGFQQIFIQSVLILITVTAIILYKPVLLPLILLIMLPPVFFIGFFLKKKLATSRRLGKQAGEKSIQHLQEALTGFIESNTHGKKIFFTDRYDYFQSALNRYLAERIALQNMPSRMIEVFAVLGLFLLIALNYFFSGVHSVQLLTIGALMISAYKIIPGIVRIINMISQIKTYSYTTEDLAMALQYSEQAPAFGGAPIGKIDSVEFKNIRFGYDNKTILNSFSGRIETGDMVGVSGLSGNGKTTLINILLGFLTQDSGEIYVNGELCIDQAKANYRPRISYAKQHPFFLHASIAVNLTFQEEGYDENKLRDIIKITGLDHLVFSFEKGLNTVITENGKNFSGGQRQRFSLARALYRNFDLLILDEPFSELDRDSEIQLLKHLRNLAFAGKMILLITHNEEALEICTKKFKLDEN